LFVFRRLQCILDRLQNGADTRPVGLGVPIGRACFEIVAAKTGLEVAVRTSPQKEIKHRGFPVRSHDHRRKMALSHSKLVNNS